MAISFVIFVGIVSLAQACNVPVFRYALERWPADRYRAIVVHRGPLTESEREIIRPLQDLEDQSHANLTLRLVDLDDLDDAAEAALIPSHGGEGQPDGLPQLALLYPESLQIDKPLFKGPLSAESVAALSTSPERKELTSRLASGQTAVWLLLECGDKEKDDAAAALLEAELSRLEKELVLPELTDAPQDSLLTTAPLEIQFSTQRIPRASAEEGTLVQMLLASEPDLAERTSDPMIFPVFGRGRALFALVGAGITAQNIQSSAEFLAGACSCEVKELNPGFDLLLQVDWDRVLFADSPPTSVQTRHVAAAQSDQPELVPIPAGHQKAGSVSEGNSPTRLPSEGTSHSPTRRASESTAPASTANRSIVFFGGIAFAVALLFIAGLASTRR